ncbi:MAG: hypothetical protein Kow0060_03520 [Methylohalobius crimeensis]|uniref:DUF1674 domain-containing protein n=1 Tax=Methylohalobius crimeensis TaxID=244365 RepID=UPI0003B49436|nr:DUF1674 domain-containing protein [Methylohalobius crimeensis]
MHSYDPLLSSAPKESESGAEDPRAVSGSESSGGEKPARVPISNGVEEIPGRPVDPTRYRDWEKNGRCIDF